MPRPELKQCPYCGMANQDELGISRRVVMVCNRSDLVFNGACSCGALGPDADSAEGAIEKWNRRAGEQESTP